jgi:hypothetical protein
MIRNEDGLVGIWKEAVMAFFLGKVSQHLREGFPETMKHPTQDS